MSTQYLTADHQDPGQFIRHDGMLIPREIYQLDPATYGLVAHVTPDGLAPLGYTVWVEQADGSFSRNLAGTQEERDAALLQQARVGMEVSALQGMLALNTIPGAVVKFLAWESALDPITDFEVLAFFEKSPRWKRTNVYLVQAATALGLSDEQLDSLFALAVTL